MAENYLSKLVSNSRDSQYQLDYCCEGKIKNLKKINPNIKVKTVIKKIDSKNLNNQLKRENIDIVIEAVDDEYTKKLIFETAICLGKKVVCASGVAGYGDCENIKIKLTVLFSLVF